jgi:DNA polymerase sigma
MPQPTKAKPKKKDTTDAKINEFIKSVASGRATDESDSEGW